MTKILWHSNAPFAPSGYGQQTALFAPRIRDAGHDVAISAFYGVQGSLLDWNGMTLYPSDHTGWGKARLRYYAAHHAAGQVDPRDVLVITLMDVWKLNDHADKLHDLRLASWVPVDHQPCPPLVAEFFELTGARPIAMSRFGERMLQKEGLDPLYVPHGVDTNLLRPVDGRDEVRAGMGIPDGAFVVGMVANNKGWSPPRKAFPQVFQAFAEFRRRHDDAFLFLHSDAHGFGEGLKLKYLADSVGMLPESYGCTDQMVLHLGVPPEQMRFVYAAFDVLASPSYGEGFGIPIVEAQACGVPVIVTDWTAMPELCGAGWLVDGEPWFDASQGAYFKSPSVPLILEALEAAYQARDDEGLRVRAREFALQYDADRVMADFWLPVLAELDRPREVPALTNRATRRAAAKKTGAKKVAA